MRGLTIYVGRLDGAKTRLGRQHVCNVGPKLADHRVQGRRPDRRPRKGAIAQAITATGQSIMAISRDHGLNPSQMRRLAADTVAKVDLVRTEAIAKTLGKQVSDLFGEAADKAEAE